MSSWEMVHEPSPMAATTGIYLVNTGDVRWLRYIGRSGLPGVVVLTSGLAEALWTGRSDEVCGKGWLRGRRIETWCYGVIEGGDC